MTQTFTAANSVARRNTKVGVGGTARLRHTPILRRVAVVAMRLAG
ncbi:MAG: hypothetical protein Q8J96_05390 [Rhodocyclaceae bacterium]|nr:hypothetical protein [Rhodocyclaceae bacterium]